MTQLVSRSGVAARVLVAAAFALPSCATPPRPGQIVAPPLSAPPAEALTPRSHAGTPDDFVTLTEPLDSDVPDDWPAPVHDDQPFLLLRAEQLEYRKRSTGSDVVRWEAQGRYGSDYERLWVKTEGEVTVEGESEGELEVQTLYSRVVAPFWDVQAGVRYDRELGSGPRNDRWFGVLGVQGLSRYEFEVEAALFVSEDADVSARLTATTDILFTQRLILQARFETEVAAQRVPDFQVGQGFNYLDLGLRLRYEFKREIAPYIGVNWIRSVGPTADLVREDGGETSDLALVAGIALWF